MLLAALNEVIASEDWDVEGEMPSATVHRRDAEPIAFNAGNKNDVAHIDGRGGLCPTLRASRSGTNGTPTIAMRSPMP